MPSHPDELQHAQPSPVHPHALDISRPHTLESYSTPSPHRCTLTPSPSHALTPWWAAARPALTGAPSHPRHLTASCPGELQRTQPSPVHPRRQICTPPPGVGDGQADIVWRRSSLRMSAFSARFQVKIVLFSVTYRQKKVARSHNFELYERAFRQKLYKKSGEKE